MISFWLQQCAEHRRTAAPVHWTFLARAAAHSTRYDRATLGRVLGESGRWFLRQNPEWRRLAADAVAGALTPLPPPSTGRTRGPAPSVNDLARDPDLAFAQPGPWPPELVAATWALIGSGELGPRVVTYAIEVGIRMPPELYPKLADAAAYYLQAPDASPAERRAIRHSFLALEEAAYARARIAAAFAETPVVLDRVEIPYV